MEKKFNSVGQKNNGKLFVLQMILSFICAEVFADYMKLSNTVVVIFPIAIVFFVIQSYAWKNKSEFEKGKWWYLIFSIGISTVIIVCKHMVVEFYNFYSDINANYILEYRLYDLVAFIILVYVFMVLSFAAVRAVECKKIADKVMEEKHTAARPVGIANVKWCVALMAGMFICWLPYFILYYPGIIYGDSLSSIEQTLGAVKYNNIHPFMFTMFVKFCFYLSHLIGGGNTLGCAIFSVLQMLLMSGVFAYSICWLRNKNVSKKVCVIVFIFFAIPRFWGQHAVSMWKDPIFAVAVYFYSLKLFDLVYSKGVVAKSKKYLVQSIISLLVVCFSRNNGIYLAIFSLIVMIMGAVIGKHRWILKKGLIFATVITVIFSWIIQGPVFKKFEIVGSAAGAYGVPLQQVARTVVYDGNISDEEKEFLNNIMPLDQYRENYSPGLVDHMKWSPQFNSTFFGTHHGEFLKVWCSLLIKNPKLFIEAWALETSGFWGLTYWKLNEYPMNILIGVPRDAKLLEEKYDIITGSLLEEDSSLDNCLKQYYSLSTAMPSIALCVWITLFMLLYAIIKGKWHYALFFIPGLGNIATLLIATPICYWPRYGLSSICLLPISLLFPYLIMEQNEKCEEIVSQ